MSDLSLDLDISELRDLIKTFEGVEEDLNRSVQLLAGQTHLHILEQAQERLHTRREMYVKALSKPTEISPGVYMITLKEDAVWIEEGMCVCYGPAKRTQPTVLTPDGWVRIPEVVPGMLVLNQYGKWTRVVEVFDNPLLDFCQELIDDETTFTTYGHRFADLSRRSKKKLVLRCVKCDGKRTVSKYDWSRTKQTFCPVCAPDMDLVTIKTKILRKNRRFTVTGGHPVATERGWVEARNLVQTDRLLVPMWGVCPICGDKVPFGVRRPCSSKCGAASYQRQALVDGKHVSQRPNWLSDVYSKVLQKGNRISGAEEAVASVLTKIGQTVKFQGADGNSDWVRQFRVPSGIDRLGRCRYFFIDFYNHRLNLALEIDGSGFHTQAQDEHRDKILLEQGIRTIRVSARAVRSRKFERDILPAIIANHEGDIVYKSVPVIDLKIRGVSRDLGLTRRWDIRVEDGSSFVCHGILVHNSPHSMVKDLLGDNPKVAKDGSRYRVIPFEHSKGGATQNTPAEMELVNAIKGELKKLRVPWAAPERNTDGSPKSGVVRKLDIQGPARPGGTEAGPGGNQHGYGHGAVGAPMQGPTGIPFLKGVTISQNPLFNTDGTPKLDKKGKQMAAKSITTFRVVSSKHEGERWKYPGIEGVHFLDDGCEWAGREWEQKILPELLKKWGTS